MKKQTLIGLVAISVVVAGCGGSGSGSSRSPFAGTYSGTYASVATDNDDNGTVAITVASDGTITGSATDSRYGDNGVIGDTSVIHKDGSIVLRLAFPSEVGQGVSTSFQGTLTGSSGNTYVGTLNEQQGDFDVPFTFTLNRDSN